MEKVELKNIKGAFVNNELIQLTTNNNNEDI